MPLTVQPPTELSAAVAALEITMRNLLGCLGLLMLTAGEASGQAPLTISPADRSDTRSIRSGDALPAPAYRRVTPAQELIFRRAAYRAQQRAARLEARRWTGYTAQRPNIIFDVPVVEWRYFPWTQYESWIIRRLPSVR